MNKLSLVVDIGMEPKVKALNLDDDHIKELLNCENIIAANLIHNLCIICDRDAIVNKKEHNSCGILGKYIFTTQGRESLTVDEIKYLLDFHKRYK